MAKVYLSLGSNVNAEENLSSLAAILRQRFSVVIFSPVYQCPSEGFEGNDFLNLAALIETDLEVETLKQLFSNIEDEFGRDRQGERFSDRTLDIDILLYDDLVIRSESLKIPRDDIEKYAFVLGPLVDIAPRAVHPLKQCTLAELWADFPEEKKNLTRLGLEF